jgi:hypothetical protein
MECKLTFGGAFAAETVASAPAMARAVKPAECEADHCHGNTSEVCGGGARMLVYNYTCTPARAAAN